MGSNAAPLIEREDTMVVIISWYTDGSGPPLVRFENPKLMSPDAGKAIGRLIAEIRATALRKCHVYEVTDNDFELIYDSTDESEEQ
jgi:hypothetical protein